ncbi:Dicer-like protein [Elsinoe fawcettii]|nr:Dicer-like protein [Elsinoe fawcettii]
MTDAMDVDEHFASVITTDIKITDGILTDVHEIEATSDDSDENDDDQPLTTQAKKRKQRAIFRTWVLQQAALDIQPTQHDRHRNPQKQQLSISQIIGEQESEHIIDDPREYQLELFERAKQQNTIAVLDTGTGKTLIAVLLLRHVIDQELDDRLAGKPSRIAFFLVPAVNLVFQQQAVLKHNLNYEVTRIYGAMGIDLWTKDKWIKHFSSNKVIVCTPEVLHLCLSHGFIRMDQINLLIFDEAHHAKQSHPYCKIMRDYFHPLGKELRPRIFGMTASPIDAKAEDMDVVDLALELEATLHSTIATTSHLAPLSNHIHRPREVKETYQALPRPSQTSFCADLCAKYGHFHFMKKLSERSMQMHAQLGQWCADRFWHLALPEKIAQKSDMHIERYARPQNAANANNEGDIAEMRELLNHISSQPLVQPTMTTVSPKVLLLRKCLADFFSGPSDYRCIVFVRERHTATLLSEVFNALGGLCIHCDFLIGVGSMDMANPASTLREQVLTLKKFRDGTLNCLFATSVAEEGLDVPSCNLIIRFDPCQTMIQYVQSRGRARQKNSTFIHMLEAGNRDHAIMHDDNNRAEQSMRSFCARLPEDRRLTGNEDLLIPEILQHSVNSYDITSSGAKLTLSNAVTFLAHYVSTLPNSGDEPLRAQYVVTPTAGGFYSEIVLPTCSPVRGSRGKNKRRKIEAKCSAAFFTCVELKQRGMLDDHLLPIFKDRLPTMRNAALALDLKGKGSYVMKHKPDFWHHGQLPEILYGVIFDFSAGLDQPYKSLIILSRNELPHIPSFPVYLNSGAASNVILRRISGGLSAGFMQLELLTRFALKIFKDIFNKTYEYDPAKMSYWIAPAKTVTDERAILESKVDWDLLEQICGGDDPRWTSEMEPSGLVDRFLVDPFDGGKRYFTKSLVTTMKACDPNPDYVKEEGHSPSVIETTVSLWKKSRLKASWDPDQPVLEAERLLHRRNMLAEVIDKELEGKAKCYVCPQPLRISRIPVTVASTCYALPAVIWRIESHLIAREAFDHLQLEAHPSLALEALTKDSDATGDYGEDLSKVKFERGMGRNYERLEFLGDTFLKMATTIDTYIRNPDDTEFDFHVRRMVQLCNANLFQTAEEIGLTDHIRTQSFSRRTWYPEGIKLLEGKGVNKQDDITLRHALGRKTIADVCEAIIGAAWLSENVPGKWTPESWDNAVSAVTKLVNSKIDRINEAEKIEKHQMLKWTDYSKAYIIPEWQKLEGKQIRGYELHLADQVAAQHPYRFKNVRLLHAAFTHPSMPRAYESVRSYQQLEFLGDSLLDMACVSYLIYHYPDEGPQWLTEHKMAMVANRFLGALCVMLGFHRNLRYSTHKLGPQIKNYAEELEEAQKNAGDAKDFWTSVSDPPKCLADIVEAYIGAMFLDSNFDYNQVQKFFDMHMLPYFEDMEIYDTFANDHPIVRLHRLLGDTLGCREYRVFAEEEPAIDSSPARAYVAIVVHDAVIGGDVSMSVRYGKARSAHGALTELEGLSVSQFRAKYGCDCRAEDAEGAMEIGMAV